MAKIHPFRGYRYDPSRVGDVGKVVTQPYDKISPALQQDYLQRSPYNLAWVIKSPEKDRDPETAYPEAGRRFLSWLQEGILRQDAEPCLYPYTQEFVLDGRSLYRTAFIGLLDLKDNRMKVRAHERTMAEPKQDRLRLMRATEGNDGLIFMLYRHPTDRPNSVLRQCLAQHKPWIDVQDDFGVRHRLWGMSDRQQVQEIQEAMQDVELFIADGHHRFETALNFMHESEEKGWKPAGVESFDKRMVALIHADDPGLAILPTHRLIHNVESFNPGQFLERTGEYFAHRTFENLEALLGGMAGGPSTRIGFCAAQQPGFHLLTLNNPSVLDGALPGRSADYRHLDVNVLHSLILDRILGIDEARLVAGTHVNYARDAAGAVEKVKRGEFQSVFLLNPTTVDQVLRVAGHGERMPQKSTDFYPKLLSGLVFMKMQIARWR